MNDFKQLGLAYQKIHESLDDLIKDVQTDEDDKGADIDERGKYWYDENDEFHRDDDKPAVAYTNGAKWWFKHGNLHRDNNKPAVIHANGTKEYWKDGQRYTPIWPLRIPTKESLDDLVSDVQEDEDKKRVKVSQWGTLEWFDEEGKLHRDNDKPASIKLDGTRSWWQHGWRHRDNGPAIEYPDGTSAEWWKKGRRYKKRLTNGLIEFDSDNIRESLNDLIQDVESDELEKKYGVSLKQIVVGGDYNIKDGIVDVSGDVYMDNFHLPEIPWKFGKVTGEFDCSRNKLTNLKNCPTYVGGNFYCSRNELTTLEGAPEVIGGSFYCAYNKELTSMYGLKRSSVMGTITTDDKIPDHIFDRWVKETGTKLQIAEFDNRSKIYESLDDLIKDVQSDEDDKGFTIGQYGEKAWFDEEGKLHRDNDKPALISRNNSKHWYQHGRRHRDNDKPAIIFADGQKKWFRHGLAYLPAKPNDY